MKKILFILFIAVLASNQAWAGGIWNCELTVGDRGNNPCLVGDFVLPYSFSEGNSSWVGELKHLEKLENKSEVMQEYNDYYLPCTDINTVIKEINNEKETCLVEDWNMIFFKTSDVMAKTSKYKPSSGTTDKEIAENLWKNRSDFNGGEIMISHNSIINAGRTVLMAGYNVLVNNSESDICIGDPNNDKPCKEDRNVETLEDPVNVGEPDLQDAADYGESYDDFDSKVPSGDGAFDSDDTAGQDDGSDYPTILTDEEAAAAAAAAAAVQEATFAEADAKEAEDAALKKHNKEIDAEIKKNYKYHGQMDNLGGGTDFCPPGYFEREQDGEGGAYYIYCDDAWVDGILEDAMGFYYGMSITSPANWTGSKYYGDKGYSITIFAGDRTKTLSDPTVPYGSYSKITVDTDPVYVDSWNLPVANAAAFTVKGDLVLRDLRILVRSGLLAIVKEGGRLYLENVVIICGDDKTVCNSESLIKNKGQLAMDKNTRFYVDQKVINKLPKDFSYINLDKGSKLYFYDSPGNSGIFYSVKYAEKHPIPTTGTLTATILPGGRLPIKTGVDVGYKVGKDSSTAPKNCDFKTDTNYRHVVIGKVSSTGVYSTYSVTEEKLSVKPTLEEQAIYSGYYIIDDPSLCTLSFERDCGDKYPIFDTATSTFSCKSLPTNGFGWTYDEKNYSFFCDTKNGAILKGDTCVANGCPYGSKADDSGACVCETGREKYSSGDNFICIKTCGEHQHNVNKDQNESWKKLVVKDGYGNQANSLAAEADICICDGLYQMIDEKCVDTVEEESKCLAKGQSWKYENGICDCNAGFVKKGDYCEKSLKDECLAKGTEIWKYDSANNDCVCKNNMNGTVDPLTCACPDGTQSKNDYTTGFMAKCVKIGGDDNGGGTVEPNSGGDDNDDGKGTESKCDASGGLEWDSGLKKCVCQDDWHWTEKNSKGILACAKDIVTPPPETDCNVGEKAVNGSCVCDSSDGWSLNTLTGECQKGGDVSAAKSGCGLNIATGGSSTTPQNMAMLLPYLILLAGLKLRKKRPDHNDRLVIHWAKRVKGTLFAQPLGKEKT